MTALGEELLVVSLHPHVKELRKFVLIASLSGPSVPARHDAALAVLPGD